MLRLRHRYVAIAVALLASVAASSLMQLAAAQGSPTTAEPISKPKSPPSRHVAVEPTEIEVLNFVDDVDPDPQAYAVGLSAGLGGLVTKGSGRAVPAANFSFTFDFGLGPGGARVPWSIEPFAAFSITAATFNSDVQVFPDRFTELGSRLIYRGVGALDGHFFSLGLGLVWTSYGSCSDPNQCDNRHDLTPAGLLDLGFGIQEWTRRGARYGFGVATPIELSKHPGFGAFAFFYGQLGLGR